MTVRLLLDSSRGWTAALSLWVLAAATLPNLTLLAMGAVVGRVPGAARHGLGSADGHHLITALVVAGALFAGSLLVGPIQVGLSSSIKVRLTYAMQSRLMMAVSGPTGIVHLEDADVLDRVAQAQGSLMSYYPADAAVTLAGIIGTRLGGLFACGVLASFRWWLGAAGLVLWLLARTRLRRVIMDQVKSFGGSTEVMRRALYFMNVAAQPQAAKELRVFGLGKWVVDQFKRHSLEGMAASWKNLARMHRVVLVVAAGVFVLLLTGAIVLGDAALHHEISLQVFTVMLLMLVMSTTVGSITFADIGLEFMVSSLPNLRQLETTLCAVAPALRGTGSAAGLPQRELRFEDLTFIYPGASAPVLDHLQLVLHTGASTAIVGLNGAGKTTLVKLMARLHDPSSGRIRVDGIALTDLDAKQWQHQIAVVFQDFNRYPLSAAENVSLGSPEHRGDAAGIARAIQRAGADTIVDSLPFGAQTILSAQYEKGSDLSGGQWQRIALARALFAVEHGARVLVLDEPTASLDVRGEAEFFDRFLEITAGVTTIVISHRFSTVRRAERVCVLEGGRITEQGTHDELLTARGTYATMFHMQAARFADTDPGGAAQ
jgi:ATP-binding cassette, subfamily B, bacterial